MGRHDQPTAGTQHPIELPQRPHPVIEVMDHQRKLSENQDIIDTDGAVVDSRSIGIWIGRESESPDAQDTDQDEPVVTTTPDMPDEPIDPDGLEFQAEVTEDGTVTFEEFEQADHWKTCMEEHGVTDVEYTIDRTGGLNMGVEFAWPHHRLVGVIR